MIEGTKTLLLWRTGEMFRTGNVLSQVKEGLKRYMSRQEDEVKGSARFHLKKGGGLARW